MVYTYRKVISGSEIIAPHVKYSFVYEMSGPHLFKKSLKGALDLLVGRMLEDYPLETVNYRLWYKPDYRNIEILVVWEESPGEEINVPPTVQWFAQEVERLARERYPYLGYLHLYLRLQEIACFLPKEKNQPASTPSPPKS